MKRITSKLAPIEPKSAYSEVEWRLNKADTRYRAELEKKKMGLRSRLGIQPSNSGFKTNKEIPKKFPIYALLYKFRSEHDKPGALFREIDQHNNLAKMFPRCKKSEMLKTDRGNGLIMFWIGVREDDFEETKQDAIRFMQRDPLWNESIVEHWDLLDLNMRPSLLERMKKMPPTAVQKMIAEAKARREEAAKRGIKLEPKNSLRAKYERENQSRE